MEKHSVFDRCVALSTSSLLNERQIGWSGRWRLMDDFVVCSQRLERQPIDKADQLFVHLPGCVAIKYGLYPWHELVAVLIQILPLPNEHIH